MNDAFVDRMAAALVERFEAVVGHVLRGNARVWHGIDVRRTRGPGLECYLAFDRTGTAGEEDVVVAFGYARFGRGTTAGIDVSTGEGVVLAEGPSAVFTPGAERETWVAQQDDYLGDVSRFLEEIHPILESQLW